MIRPYLVLLICIVLASCGSEDDQPQGLQVDFDRSEMLAHWMNDLFIPRQANTLERLRAMESAFDTWTQNQDSFREIEEVRTTFNSAYLSYQQMAPFILKEGEALRLRELTNTYPTSVARIEANLAGDANLDLPSNTDAQGFPALEYLLFTNGPIDEEPLIKTSAAAANYAFSLIRKLIVLHEAHLTALENGSEAYVANDGNSATASIDRTVNDYLFYYERFFRAGKIGIPAGVFSDDPLADRVESLYQGNSKALFFEALKFTRDFYNKEGLRDYLDAVQQRDDNDRLGALITTRFAAIDARARILFDNFSVQVEQDNSKMLELYDELQKVTVLLKVDMLQALNINVDYVDADGD